jgi:hypothetical protein
MPYPRESMKQPEVKLKMKSYGRGRAREGGIYSEVLIQYGSSVIQINIVPAKFHRGGFPGSEK